MGPEASADIYLRLIRLFHERAKDNMEAYPHIIINSIPLPYFYLLKGKAIGVYLGKEASRLERSGTEVLAVACNSAHYYLDDIRAALNESTDLINIIEEIVDQVQLNGISSIGLLSTSLAKSLYIRTCKAKKNKLKALDTQQQQTVEDIILNILRGQANVTSKSTLKSLALNLLSSGAECIVLGCTDLPLLLDRTEVDYPLYSSNEILADAIFSHAIKK